MTILVVLAAIVLILVIRLLLIVDRIPHIGMMPSLAAGALLVCLRWFFWAGVIAYACLFIFILFGGNVD